MCIVTLSERKAGLCPGKGLLLSGRGRDGKLNRPGAIWKFMRKLHQSTEIWVACLHRSPTLFLWFLHCEDPSRRLIFERETEKTREREKYPTNEVLMSTLSSQHTNLPVAKFQRNCSSLSISYYWWSFSSTISHLLSSSGQKLFLPVHSMPGPVCQPLYLILYFSGYCTVRLKVFIFCVCFLCIFVWKYYKPITVQKENHHKPRQHIKKPRHHFANRGPYSQSYGFSSRHVRMWELDHKEDWALNWCFWITVLEKTLKSPLDSKKIKWVYPKGNQLWIFLGRTDAEAEAPILWPPDMKRQLIGKDPVTLNPVTLNIDEGLLRSLLLAGLYQYLLDNKYCYIRN